MLPDLSEGNHNVTVYYGWQYLGIPENPSLERFEVSSFKTVEFTVDTSPSPTPSVPEFSWLAILPLLAGMFSVAVIFRQRKTAKTR